MDVRWWMPRRDDACGEATQTYLWFTKVLGFLTMVTNFGWTEKKWCGSFLRFLYFRLPCGSVLSVVAAPKPGIVVPVSLPSLPVVSSTRVAPCLSLGDDELLFMVFVVVPNSLGDLWNGVVFCVLTDELAKEIKIGGRVHRSMNARNQRLGPTG